MENGYGKMNRDSALIVSLLADNKHSDAVELVHNHYKTHPLLHMQKRFPKEFLLDRNCLSLEGIADVVKEIIYKCLIPLITIHKCIVVLMKLNASNEDCAHLLDGFFLTWH